MILSQGKNRLESVRKLKEEVRLLHFVYSTGFEKLSPALSHIVTQASPPAQSTIHLRLDEPDAISARAYFVDPNWRTIDSVDLFDDGLHSDGTAGDGVFANSWSAVPSPFGLSVDLRITYSSGQAFMWRDILTQLTTLGPVTISSLSIASDNVNSDRVINPGENVRYTLGLSNGTSMSLRNLTIRPVEVSDPNIKARPGETFTIPEIAPQTTISLVYKEDDPTSYFSIDVPEDIPGGREFSVVMEIIDDSSNRWVDTLDFAVSPYISPPIRNISQHTVGNSEGTFGVLIVDYPSLKDHNYQLTVADSINEQGDLGLDLVDVNEGRTLFINHSLPDLLGHNMPVIDGFKIVKGSVLYEEEYPGPRVKGWEYNPSLNRFMTGPQTTIPMDAFFNGLTYPRLGVYYNKGTIVPPDSLKLVEIVFSNQFRQRGYRYLSLVEPSRPLVDSSFEPFVKNRGSGYIYQDYVEVPFTIWELDPTDGDATPRQLNVAFLENNDTLYAPTGAFVGRGKIDGQWFPTSHPTGGREIVYIFASNYSADGISIYATKNLLTEQAEFDILYVLWARLDPSLPQMFTEGDVFTIVPQYPPVRPGNLYSFNPVLLEVKPQPELPIRFALYQNYPNPFNPATTIEYEVPKESRVTLKIFDILGREVVTLVDELRSPGRHMVRWEGRNNFSHQVSSGVYFYRLQAGEWTSVKKMVFIR